MQREMPKEITFSVVALYMSIPLLRMTFIPLEFQIVTI